MVVNYKHELFNLYYKLTNGDITPKEQKRLELLIRWDNELEKQRVIDK